MLNRRHIPFIIAEPDSVLLPKSAANNLHGLLTGTRSELTLMKCIKVSQKALFALGMGEFISRSASRSIAIKSDQIPIIYLSEEQNCVTSS